MGWSSLTRSENRLVTFSVGNRTHRGRAFQGSTVVTPVLRNSPVFRVQRRRSYRSTTRAGLSLDVLFGERQRSVPATRWHRQLDAVPLAEVVCEGFGRLRATLGLGAPLVDQATHELFHGQAEMAGLAPEPGLVRGSMSRTVRLVLMPVPPFMRRANRLARFSRLQIMLSDSAGQSSLCTSCHGSLSGIGDTR